MREESYRSEELEDGGRVRRFAKFEGDLISFPAVWTPWGHSEHEQAISNSKKFGICHLAENTKLGINDGIQTK